MTHPLGLRTKKSGEGLLRQPVKRPPPTGTLGEPTSILLIATFLVDAFPNLIAVFYCLMVVQVTRGGATEALQKNDRRAHPRSPAKPPDLAIQESGNFCSPTHENGNDCCGLPMFERIVTILFKQCFLFLVLGKMPDPAMIPCT